ncbi:MAG: chromate resistance protein ChrB [Pseudonocardiaceae bacterium]|nr:MAG: chromate resistance protein ChrB [Pseudonocardiaceae bacterium]
MTEDLGWLVLTVRVPAQPSRHRVAVWRELRRAGALAIGQGCWAIPDVPAAATLVPRVRELAARGEGEAVVLTASGRTPDDAARLEARFTAEREAEWTGFLAECDEYDAEIDEEIRTEKFTLAELHEEERSLERLRRRHREIRMRDVFGATSASRADELFKHCACRLEEFTERVFAALHQS